MLSKNNKKFTYCLSLYHITETSPYSFGNFRKL